MDPPVTGRGEEPIWLREIQAGAWRGPAAAAHLPAQPRSTAPCLPPGPSTTPPAPRGGGTLIPTQPHDAVHGAAAATAAATTKDQLSQLVLQQQSGQQSPGAPGLSQHRQPPSKEIQQRGLRHRRSHWDRLLFRQPAVLAPLRLLHRRPGLLLHNVRLL